MQKVVEFIKNQKLVFWRILNGTNNNMLLGSFPIEDTENPSLSDSVAEFEKMLEILPAGAYLLKGRSRKTATNTEVNFPFVIGQENNNSNGNGLNNDAFSYIENLTKNYNSQMLAIQIESIKRESEAKIKEIEARYKAEIDKLKVNQDKPDTIDKLINLAPILLPFFAPKMPQVQNPANLFETLLQAQKTQENLEKNQAVELDNVKSLLGEKFEVVMTTLDTLAKNSPEFVRGFANQLLILANVPESEPENQEN